jgi:hypothetical protein
VLARNRLIPEAEKIANSKVATVPPGEADGESYARWTRCFSGAMNTLAAPLLNGSSG